MGQKGQRRLPSLAVQETVDHDGNVPHSFIRSSSSISVIIIIVIVSVIIIIVHN